VTTRIPSGMQLQVARRTSTIYYKGRTVMERDTRGSERKALKELGIRNQY